jgi:hypothetical protein
LQTAPEAKDFLIINLYRHRARPAGPSTLPDKSAAQQIGALNEIKADGLPRRFALRNDEDLLIWRGVADGRGYLPHRH